jgi:hypothetical protein
MSTPEEAVEDANKFLEQQAKDEAAKKQKQAERAAAIQRAKPQVEKLYFYVTQPAGPSVVKIAIWVILTMVIIGLIAGSLAPKVDGKYTDGYNIWRVLSWPKFGERNLIFDGPERLYGSMANDGSLIVRVGNRDIVGQWNGESISFNDGIIFKRLH